MNKYLILPVGIISVSFASIFIRWIEDASGIAIAFHRILFAVILMAPAALQRLRRERQNINLKNIKFVLIGGIALGLHFTTWITSLHFTSVATSVILVSTNPIFLFIMGILILGEKPNKGVALGILLSIIGTIIIASVKFEMHNVRDLYGAGLALSGAVFGSVYMLAGKRLRIHFSAISYSFMVYSVSLVVVFIILLISQKPLSGYAPVSYLLFFLLAFFPQMIGHTSFNYILKFFSPAVVALFLLAEPIGASILAMILLSEMITLHELIGGVIILSGIYISVKSSGNS